MQVGSNKAVEDEHDYDKEVRDHKQIAKDAIKKQKYMETIHDANHKAKVNEIAASSMEI